MVLHRNSRNPKTASPIVLPLFYSNLPNFLYLLISLISFPFKFSITWVCVSIEFFVYSNVLIEEGFSDLTLVPQNLLAGRSILGHRFPTAPVSLKSGNSDCGMGDKGLPMLRSGGKATLFWQRLIRSK